jgi:Flp pilus assembly protein CpaB
VLRRRLPRTTLLFLAGALACAAAAAAIVRGALAEAETLRAATGPLRPMVVAARFVERGAVLVEDDLRIAEVPSAFAPPGALADPAEADGRVVLTDLVAGEPLTRSRLAHGRGPLAALVPPGLRAIAVPVLLVPEGLAPGDRVDLLAAPTDGRPYAETLAEAAEVLRVPPPRGGTLSGETEDTLVVLVDPAAALRLARVGGGGALSVAVVGTEGG